MNKQNIILIGGGGHCKSCIDVIELENKYQIEGILDVKEKIGEKILKYLIVGTDDEIPNYVQKGYLFLVTVGHIKSADLRKYLFNKVKVAKGKFATIISPTAHVSNHATIRNGTIIMHQTIINADSLVGENTIINNKALVEHGCRIGNNCHISTASVINGDCIIGDETFVGSGAILKQGISIAPKCVIGAGSVVTKNITEPCVYVGIPAKKIK